MEHPKIYWDHKLLPPGNRATDSPYFISILPRPSGYDHTSLLFVEPGFIFRIRYGRTLRAFDPRFFLESEKDPPLLGIRVIRFERKLNMYPQLSFELQNPKVFFNVHREGFIFIDTQEDRTTILYHSSKHSSQGIHLIFPNYSYPSSFLVSFPPPSNRISVLRLSYGMNFKVEESIKIYSTLFE